MSSITVGSIEVIDGSSYFAFNLERGYKYFEYVEKVEKVFKYFDELLSNTNNKGSVKVTHSMMQEVVDIPMFAKLKFNCRDKNGKVISYEIASDMQSIKEKLKYEGEFYHEVVHTGAQNGEKPEIKYYHYSYAGKEESIGSDEIISITRDFYPTFDLAELFKVLKDILKTRVVYSPYELQSADRNQNTLALLKTNSAVDLDKGQNLNVLVSFSDIYNAQINSSLIESEAIDKSLSNRIFTELANADVKVRMLRVLSEENN